VQASGLAGVEEGAHVKEPELTRAVKSRLPVARLLPDRSKVLQFRIQCVMSFQEEDKNERLRREGRLGGRCSRAHFNKGEGQNERKTGRNHGATQKPFWNTLWTLGKKDANVNVPPAASKAAERDAHLKPDGSLVAAAISATAKVSFSDLRGRTSSLVMATGGERGAKQRGQQRSSWKHNTLSANAGAFRGKKQGA